MSEVGIQWNPSKTDTTGTHDFVRYTGVSFTEGTYKPHPLKLSVLVINLWPKNAVHGPGVNFQNSPLYCGYPLLRGVR